jgi:hypothetical protein
MKVLLPLIWMLLLTATASVAQAQGCIPCGQWCARCNKANLDRCYADCKRRGEPCVNRSCGVRDKK